MAYYSFYFSPTGGTKKAADLLMRGLCEEYQEADLCKGAAEFTLTAEDVCLVSVPSFGGRVPAVALQRLQKVQANGAKAILNCVYGNREWDDTLTELQDTLEDLGFVCVAAVAAVAEHSVYRKFAAGRPDTADAAELLRFAAAIAEKLAGGVFAPLQLAGSHGSYIAYNGAPYKPNANDTCIACGRCAAECPVGAIDPTDAHNTDAGRCISCMRCISLCPVHARDLDAAFMKEREAKLGPLLGGQKENHLFL